MAFKACAVWQWWNYLRSEVPPEKTPLRVNIDETVLCLFQGGSKGNLFLAKAPREPVQNVTLSTRRCYMTHVAVVCDEPHLNRILPQFIIGNFHTLSLRAHAKLCREKPGHVRLIRRNTAWVDQILFAAIVRLVAATLRMHMGARQIILFFDSTKVHTADIVFRSCARSCVWPIVVPPKMTWLLQSLDTHCFAKYKHSLRSAFQDARAEVEGGTLDIGQFLRCVYTAWDSAVQRHCWAHAFDQNGFGIDQSCLSRTVRRHLELDVAAEVSNAAPSALQLQLCFPRGFRMRADLPLSSSTRRAAALVTPGVCLIPALSEARPATDLIVFLKGTLPRGYRLHPRRRPFSRLGERQLDTNRARLNPRSKTEAARRHLFLEPDKEIPSLFAARVYNVCAGSECIHGRMWPPS